jgi:hypothetical protein
MRIIRAELMADLFDRQKISDISFAISDARLVDQSSGCMQNAV